MARDYNGKLPMQESVLSLLCYDVKAGSQIAASVNHMHFDDIYSEFAQRVLQYRRKYKKPPGRSHVNDIARRLSGGKDSLIQSRLLPRLKDEDINSDYVVSRTEDFVRRQLLKRVIIQASDRFETENDELLPEVEHMLQKALRFRQHTMDAGMFLNDPRGLEVAEQNEDYISLGIPILDDFGVGLVPKEVILYIAPKGTGKTWFCVHCGRMTVHGARKKALHVTLEMSERKIMRRYYQTFFSVARVMEKVNRTRLLLDDLGNFYKFKKRKYQPKLAFSQKNIRRVIRAKLNDWGTRLGDRLVVKQFPTGQLKLDQLNSYLDFLGDVHDFIPDTLIVDYPDLMDADPRYYRHHVARNFEGLRGICVERNMAGVFPTQGTRKTIHATKVRSTDAAEDIRKVNAADVVMTFSRTEEEEERGLGRLKLEHVRDNPGGAEILLSQSYDTGQYVIDSVRMQRDRYWEQLKRASGGDPSE